MRFNNEKHFYQITNLMNGTNNMELNADKNSKCACAFQIKVHICHIYGAKDDLT